MHLKSWNEKHIAPGTRVFLRIDGNVPVINGQARDGAHGRLVQTIPEIIKLKAHGARIILATHVGEPAGEFDKKYSVKPVAKLLSKLLKREIKLLSGVKGKAVQAEILKTKPGEILMLENLRFEQGEIKNSAVFAEALASLADIYINNAFGVCHREHASVVAITKKLPSFAGGLLIKEIEALSGPYTSPLTVVIGGLKLLTKAPLIINLAKTADHVLIGGALCLPFLAALERPLPKKILASIKAEDIKLAEKILRLSAGKIILPLDLHVIADKQVVDVGLKTEKMFANIISQSNSVIWNGPLGIIEEPKGRHATKSLAKAIYDEKLTTAVLGGGETVEFLDQFDFVKGFSHISTGGGAMLALLSGEKLPGLEALRR